MNSTQETWPQVGHEAIIALHPFLTILTAFLALWLLSVVVGEKPVELIRAISKEFRGLIKGEKTPESLNALMMIGGIVLIIIIFASPISEIMPEISDKEGSSSIHEGIVACLVTVFFGASILCVKVCKGGD